MTKLAKNPVRISIFVLTAVALGSHPAAAFDEPQGYKDVKFRMSIEQVKERFPGVKHVSGNEESLAFYKIEDQEFESLKPCTVKFRFAANRLYQIDFDCGRDEAVTQLLRSKFGDPSLTEENALFWYGDKILISQNRTAKTFGLIDRVLNESVHHQLLQHVLGQKPVSEEKTDTGSEQQGTGGATSDDPAE